MVHVRGPSLEQKSVNVRDFPFVAAGSGSGVCVVRMLKRRHQGGTAVVPKYLLSISPDI
jgi:hypothetical protein